MAEIHYNIYLGELRSPRQQRKYLKQIHINVIYKIIDEDNMFNILEHQLLYNILLHHMIWVQDHVYYKGGLKPQYTIMMSLQRSRSCVGEHNTILRNLGYRCEPKVFIKIQRNQYNPGHVNRCVEVEHGQDSKNYHSIGDN